MVLISLNYRNGILALVFQWALFFPRPLLHVVVSYICVFTIMLILVFQSCSIQQPQLPMLLYCSTMADLVGCMHPQWHCCDPCMFTSHHSHGCHCTCISDTIIGFTHVTPAMIPTYCSLRVNSYPKLAF